MHTQAHYFLHTHSKTEFYRFLYRKTFKNLKCYFSLSYYAVARELLSELTYKEVTWQFSERPPQMRAHSSHLERFAGAGLQVPICVSSPAKQSIWEIKQSSHSLQALVRSS